MTLAYLAEPKTPAFDPTFYVAAATIIPVFFVAITLQASAWRSLLMSTRGASKLLGRLIDLRAPRVPEWIMVPFIMVSSFPLAVPLMVPQMTLLYGTYAEIEALWALYYQHEQGRTLIFYSMILLVIVAAIGPAMTYFRTMRQVGGDGPESSGGGSTIRPPDGDRPQVEARTG